MSVAINARSTAKSADLHLVATPARRQTSPLPSAIQLREELPLPAALARQVQQQRHSIRAILDGHDPRLLVVVGPCSLHDDAAVLEYAERLAALVEDVPANPRDSATSELTGISTQAPMNKDTSELPVCLSPEEIEQFRTQGYAGPFTAFSPHEMEKFRTTVCERVLPTPTPYCPFGLRVRHLDSQAVHAMCSAPAIVERMASLYGPDLVLWNSNLFNKPPARPEQQEEYPWHQDHYNWNMEPILNISAWLAITPASGGILCPRSAIPLP